MISLVYDVLFHSDTIILQIDVILWCHYIMKICYDIIMFHLDVIILFNIIIWYQNAIVLC